MLALQSASLTTSVSESAFGKFPETWYLSQRETFFKEIYDGVKSALGFPVVVILY